MKQVVANELRENRMAALSHIGASPKRVLLEDRSRAECIRTGSGLSLLLGVVADGIGGANAGERAAEVTISTIFEYCSRSTERDISALLRKALEQANTRVYAEAKASRRKMNMGSTAAVAAIAENRLYLANVGDSRIYLLRKEEAIRLTIDHTWEHEIVRNGRLSAADAARHPRKDELVRSIGYDPSVKVDLGIWFRGGEESEAEAEAAQGLPLHAGDRVLICSDGVTKARHDNPHEHYVEEADLVDLTRGRSPEEAVEAILRYARSRKVDDNVSTVLLQVPGGGRVTKRRADPRRWVAAVLIIALSAIASWLLLRLAVNRPVQELKAARPALPEGVAYLAELKGFAERETGSGQYLPLQAGEIIPSGKGVRVRTGGEDVYLRLELADQSILYLGPKSQVELRAIAGGGSVLETFIVLEQGIVLVVKEEGMRRDFVVASPIGVRVEAIGTVMGVVLDMERQRLHADCFLGSCAIDGMSRKTLDAGQYLWMAANGEVGAIALARNELYDFGKEWLPEPIMLSPTWTAAKMVSPTHTLGPLFIPPTATETPTRLPEPTEPAFTPTSTEKPTATEKPTGTEKPTVTERPSRTPKTTSPATDTPEQPTEIPSP